MNPADLDQLVTFLPTALFVGAIACLAAALLWSLATDRWED